MPTVSMQRWPSQVWTCPAARVSASTTHGTAWAYGWRCPAIAGLSAIGAAANHGLVPALIEYPGRLGTATVALVGTGALAALVRLGEEQPFELGARPLGQEGHRLAQRLVGHIHDWNAQGRPGTAGLQVSAYPRDSDHAAIADANSIIEKRYTRMALTWVP
jgi:protein-L-isoaspartate(D-aspartate) O-methyltransferase